MKANIKLLRKQRQYSDDFKKEIYPNLKLGNSVFFSWRSCMEYGMEPFTSGYINFLPLMKRDLES